MSETSTDAVRGFAERLAARRGWLLHTDAKHVESVLAGLEANRRLHGYYLCPCRDGSGDRDEDGDIICPCRYVDADIQEFGHCYCGLFVSASFATAGKPVDAIPERRHTEHTDSRAAEAPPETRDLCSIKEVVRGIHQLENQLKRDHGVTLNEGICLCCISQVEHTPGGCAEQMGLSASRISRILNTLEKKGLIERSSPSGDRRITELSVTELGRKRLAALRCGGFQFSKLDGLASHGQT